MSIARLKQHSHGLHILASAKPKLRKALIRSSSKPFICCLCECIQNVLNKKVPVSSKIRDQLKRYRGTLETMIDKRKSIKSKRDILQQRGGFLPIILPTLLSVISELVGDAVRDNVQAT